MADYDNTNSGTFLWKKVAKSGVNFLSLALNPVDGAKSSAPKQATAAVNDPVPF